ncbi:MAG: hypothetical protein ABSA41_11525 [Terriglobia bacterium]
MKKLKRPLLISGTILLLFFAFHTSAHTATYYVDNCVVTGNDTNSGASSSTPWLTIAKVNSSTFSAGDSILFEKGQGNGYI